MPKSINEIYAKEDQKALDNRLILHTYSHLEQGLQECCT